MQRSSNFPILRLFFFSLFSHSPISLQKQKKSLIYLMVQTDEYQDPILTFGNVRRFVENMPGKTKVCIELHSMSTKIQAI